MSAQPQSHRKKQFIFTGCAVLLAVFGYIDYRTGYEMGFFVFYSLPIGLTAWHVGKWPAVVMAFASSITWWLADRLAGQVYSSMFSLCWNNAVHFGSFLVNAVAIAKIKNNLDERHQLANELTRVRDQLQHLLKLLPVCPKCGQPLDAEALRQQSEINLCETCSSTTRRDAANRESKR